MTIAAILAIIFTVLSGLWTAATMFLAYTGGVINYLSTHAWLQGFLAGVGATLFVWHFLI